MSSSRCQTHVLCLWTSSGSLDHVRPPKQAQQGIPRRVAGWWPLERSQEACLPWVGECSASSVRIKALTYAASGMSSSTRMPALSQIKSIHINIRYQRRWTLPSHHSGSSSRSSSSSPRIYQNEMQVHPSRSSTIEAKFTPHRHKKGIPGNYPPVLFHPHRAWPAISLWLAGDKIP